MKCEKQGDFNKKKEKQTMAVFFQKHHKNPFVSKLRQIYLKVFVRSNKAKLKSLRDAGAKIGEGVIIESIGILGSEPWLVEIGSKTRFSGVATKIFTHDGGIERLYHMGLTDQRYDYFGKVKIGSGCFIGHNCIIMKNVAIGDNCVIGAGSIVTKSIPSNSVACGVPARVICTTEEYCEKNRKYFDKVINDLYAKRCDIESKMEIYDARCVSAVEPDK